MTIKQVGIEANRAELETIYNRLTDPDPRCDECLSPIVEHGPCRLIHLRPDDSASLLYLVCKRCGASDLPNITKDAQRIRERLISKRTVDLFRADPGNAAVMAPTAVEQTELETIVKWMNACSACGWPIEGEYGEFIIQKAEGRNLLHLICSRCRSGRGIQAHAGLAISEAAVKLMTAPATLIFMANVTGGRTTVKVPDEGFTQASLESATPFELKNLSDAKLAAKFQKYLDQHLGAECKCSNCRVPMHEGYPEDNIPSLVKSLLVFCAPLGFRHFFLCDSCTEHWYVNEEAGIPRVAARLALMSAVIQ